MTDDEIVNRYTKLRRRFFRPRVKASRFQQLRKPATESELVAAEGRLGFLLPRLLRRLYLQVGNGGFGPGAGVLGVGATGLHDSLGDDLVMGRERRRVARAEDSTFSWPDRLTAFCEWGCAMFSCADLSLGNDAPVFLFDPAIVRLGESIEPAFVPHNLTLRDFLAEWINGNDLWVPHETAEPPAIEAMLATLERRPN